MFSARHFIFSCDGDFRRGWQRWRRFWPTEQEGIMSQQNSKCLRWTKPRSRILVIPAIINRTHEVVIWIIQVSWNSLFVSGRRSNSYQKLLKLCVTTPWDRWAGHTLHEQIWCPIFQGRHKNRACTKCKMLNLYSFLCVRKEKHRANERYYE